MKADIKVVFLDIDGTMYHDGRLMDSAIEAVHALQKNKFIVSLCTGRSVLHTRKVKETLGVAYGVYFNGGLVKEHHDTLYSTPIRADIVRDVIRFFEHHTIPTILHTAENVRAFNSVPDRYRPILTAFDFPAIPIIAHENWLRSPEEVYQVNVFMDKSWEPAVKAQFPECLIYRWNDNAVDLQRRRSDKSIGAQALLKQLDISPEHALHVGDGGNDIGMFKTMGYSVAMGNATDDVKHAAQTITKPVNEDGLYVALSNLGLI